MLTCPSCGGAEIGARIEQNGARVHFCRGCETIVSTQAPPAPRAARKAAGSQPADPAAQAAPAAVAGKPKAERSAPENPIPSMRRRLRWLDAEIRRLRKLEAERDTLARILSAATGKPAAVVRSLPKASHG